MDKLKTKLIINSAYYLSKLINSTLRLRVFGKKEVRKIEDKGKPIIFAVWHGQLLLPTYYFRERGYVGLASRSRDGEYISGVLKRLGWEVVRGSTSKGGARSLLKLIKKIREGKSLGITPDGPRGPIHKVKPGVIYLAQKSDALIVPVGVAFSKKKVFSSWDRFSLAYPFSKATLVYGEGMEVPKDIDSSKVEDYSRLLEGKINEAVESAERALGERR
ncbi:lysophospholipid acyltransferase family protein [Halonatronum saccharophilum]|uniref:lysophospholipid acyltransferase family protein n=1 Tax=Halonatronum saccharophilum TaxID=150060 RepID=UPI0004B4F6AF|nr:lysophospholipid acyltransferase family protein [Halonatronum saccharophilum]